MFAFQPNQPGRAKHLRGLAGAAEMLALAEQARTRRVVVLARDPAAAVRCADQLAGLPDCSATHLPGWEVLPYDNTSPPKAIASARIAALAQLLGARLGAFVLAAADAALPCMPPARLQAQALQLRVGDEVSLASLARDLDAAGCASVDRVRAGGEYAAYGGQLDLYPGGADQPYRIVLDFDRIAQIRTFNLDSQLSTGKVEAIDMLPAREYPLDDASVLAFRQRWRHRFEAQARSEVYAGVSRSEETEGAECFLPLFYGEYACLLDYLNDEDLLWLSPGWEEAVAASDALVAERYEQARAASREVLPPAELFLDGKGLRRRLKRIRTVEVHAGADASARDMGAEPLPPLGIARSQAEPAARLRSWIKERPRWRVICACSAPARRATVLASLRAAGVAAPASIKSWDEAAPGVQLLDSDLAHGFACAKARTALITEAELHDWLPPPRTARRGGGTAAAELDEYSVGDLVVHQEHGVARYQGLASMEAGGFEEEFIKLQFDKDVTLYVAVVHCHLITRLRRPEPDEPIRLHAIGGKRWQRVQAKARRAARDTAAWLLKLQAQRAAAARDASGYTLDEDEYAAFCAGFPHAETADQVRAGAEVIADLCAAAPMDRLLCGDVGFGKTEIALRAAWLAWRNGMQVAIIAPTTLLCDQLHRICAERFAAVGAPVLQLSSLQHTSANNRTLATLASGEPAIVVGTHALLGARVELPQLGLAIIDEEHRFGVRQKERLKEFRAATNILALSATPIPRTLSMALEGLRDISLIAVPPSGRLPVRSFAATDSDTMVQEALARELARGGQAFYVSHRVQTIHVARERVAELVPQAQVAVAHGQLPHAELETVMRRFYRGEIDVLVCTSIVESGLDVPNANTLIVPRAEMFGLAQLHQLRGRVGRAARQGYAYFLVPGREAAEARKARSRLETLQASDHLGGGHYIAVRDMEIRGAGEILGAAQSGAVVDIGVDAFRRMLAAAQRQLAGAPAAAADCEIDFGGHARLPAAYCSSAVERMRVYRALAAKTAPHQLEDMHHKLADRFGPLPREARLLLDCHHLRLRAAPLGMVRIAANAAGLRLEFIAEPPCADQLLTLAGSRPDCRFAASALQLKVAGDAYAKLRAADGFCTELEQAAAAS